MLHNGGEYKELMGCDYVLDLFSEMELLPNIPHKKSEFFVSFDDYHRQFSVRRSNDVEHDESQKLISKCETLSEENESHNFLHSQSHIPYDSDADTLNADDLYFSASVLNKRPSKYVSTDLSESHMNDRYMLHGLSQSSGFVRNGYLNAEGFVTVEAQNGNNVFSDDDSGINGDIDLANSPINRRYIPNDSTGDLSSSRLNSRYERKVTGYSPSSGKSAVQEQIRKRYGSAANITADVHSTTSDQSDWSHWVEDVFNSALDEHDDIAVDGNFLHAQIKGGGEGVSDLKTQQASIQCYLYSLKSLLFFLKFILFYHYS